MLTDVLRKAITQRFPEIQITTHLPPGAAIVIPAIHEGVGDISIWDDGGEATLVLSDITHGHFTDDAPGISEEEAAHLIAEDVMGFLEHLFADRVLLWKRPSGGGGWRVLADGEVPQVHSDAGTQFYFWSGPVG
jgi:hypothetical protein